MEERAYQLRLKFPDFVDMLMVPPMYWPDLALYFDPVDIHAEGAGFLFQVIRCLVKQNFEKRLEIESCVKEWMSSNLGRLASIPPVPDVLDFVLKSKIIWILTPKP